MIASVIAAVIGIAQGLALWSLVRNELVYKYQMSLLADIKRLAEADIKADPWKNVWLDRYRVLDTVSYRSMLWPPWKSLDSYFTDHRFHTDPDWPGLWEEGEV